MKKLSNIQIIITIILIGIFTKNTNAQDSTRTLIISGVPQYVINHGLRIDIEKQLPNNRQWLIISPQYYMGWVDGNRDDFDSPNPGTDGDSLFGFGFDLTHKIFLINKCGCSLRKRKASAFKVCSYGEFGLLYISPRLYFFSSPFNF